MPSTARDRGRGDRRLAGWAAFRVHRNAEEGDRHVRELTASEDVAFYFTRRENGDNNGFADMRPRLGSRPGLLELVSFDSCADDHARYWESRREHRGPGYDCTSSHAGAGGSGRTPGRESC